MAKHHLTEQSIDIDYQDFREFSEKVLFNTYWRINTYPDYDFQQTVAEDPDTQDLLDESGLAYFSRNDIRYHMITVGNNNAYRELPTSGKVTVTLDPISENAGQVVLRRTNQVYGSKNISDIIMPEGYTGKNLYVLGALGFHRKRDVQTKIKTDLPIIDLINRSIELNVVLETYIMYLTWLRYAFYLETNGTFVEKPFG